MRERDSIKIHYDEPGSLEFSANGLSDLLHFIAYPEQFTLPSGTLRLEKGTPVGHCKFLPEFTKLPQHLRYTVLFFGTLALEDLFYLIDLASQDKDFPYPKYLIGTTNRKMARILEKLGFESAIDGLAGLGSAVGEIEEVRRRFDQFRANGQMGVIRRLGTKGLADLMTGLY